MATLNSRGVVYAGTDKNAGHVKIGHTKHDAWSRIDQINRKFGTDIQEYYGGEVDRCYEVEQDTLKRFSGHCVGGEFFDVPVCAVRWYLETRHGAMDEFEALRLAEDLGLVEKCGRTCCGTYQLYRVAEKWIPAAIKSSRKIRYKRSKRMYIRFLSVTDALPDVTFKEFLTHSDFAGIRHEV